MGSLIERDRNHLLEVPRYGKAIGNRYTRNRWNSSQNIENFQSNFQPNLKTRLISIGVKLEIEQ